MAFYVGCYLILQDELDPKFGREDWAFPSNQDQHMWETSNVEDLLIDPEDMDIIPTQVQYGEDFWSDSESIADDTWGEYYVAVEHFYIRDFTPTDFFAEFYMPAEAFYVQDFTPTDLFSEFYVAAEQFYVQDFSPVDFFTEFYVTAEAFYVQRFSPIDFFYIVAEDNC